MRRGNIRLSLGAALGALLCGAALLAPILAADPGATDLAGELLPPSTAHLFGQDELGRDVFARVFVGARISLSISLMTVLVSAFGGTLLGGLAGFRGGFADGLLMRLIDVLLAFPGILLAIAL
ncbi:MAG: D,D-dipeptide ABC transporter permease, partial [Bdellovibrionota bacterium]